MAVVLPSCVLTGHTAIYLSNFMNIHFSPLTSSPSLFARPQAILPHPPSPTSASSVPLVVHTNVAYPVSVGKVFPSKDAARDYLDVYAGRAFKWRVLSSNLNRLLLVCSRREFTPETTTGSVVVYWPLRLTNFSFVVLISCASGGRGGREGSEKVCVRIYYTCTPFIYLLYTSYIPRMELTRAKKHYSRAHSRTPYAHTKHTHKCTNAHTHMHTHTHTHAYITASL